MTTTDPGALVLIAVTVIAFALGAVALVALAASFVTAAGLIRRGIPRSKKRPADTLAADDLPEPTSEEDRAALAAALGGNRTADVIAHTLHTYGRTLADIRTMTDEELLAIPGIGHTSLATIRSRLGPPAPAGNHLDIIAAALDDWWTVTDPRAEFNGADIAPHVEQYLLSSGYHITPNP